MTRLLLMRHAKSDWDSGETEDFLRPLSERGVRDARNMGRWLAAQGYLPRTVLSSPSRRTRDTLRLLGEGAGTALESRATWDDTLYLAAVPALLAALRRHGQDSGVMVLAHNPGLEELLEWLVADTATVTGHAKAFPTGAAYVLEQPEPV
ncbi:MAG: histidine phosphatase family protein, partial [Gammaproteobacteria bacterium]